MDKFSKKTVIVMVLFVIIVSVCYKFFFKRKEFLQIDSNVNMLNVYEDVNKLEENYLDTSTSDDKIVVYITGAVKSEGVYELEKDSRVVDCIELAGGVTEEADISFLNLASLLEDGMKIYIPKKGQIVNDISEEVNDNLYKDNGGIENTNSAKNDKVNINTASQKDLESLPGVGPATAVKIIEYRKDNGKFKSIEDIKKVRGIGESKFSKIKDLIKI